MLLLSGIYKDGKSLDDEWMKYELVFFFLFQYTMRHKYRCVVFRELIF